MSKSLKNKIVAVVGTTASGKTKLAVTLSLEFGGEVVSADSRQVYKYMDVGSGKDLDEYEVSVDGHKKHIPYHLIDVAHPADTYDLAKWLSDAKIAVDGIVKRQNLPIIAGGTGLYVQALLDGYNLSEANIDKQLRSELELLKREELLMMLEILDKKFAQALNQSEKNNKRRLIRHIEILKSLKDPSLARNNKDKVRPFDDLILGLTWPRELLRERIHKRIVDRLENEDMIEEVRRLNDEHGVPWHRLESFGLEYKYISSYLQDRLDYDAMLSKLYFATCQFAKRQMTWLRRWEKQGTKINWVSDYDDAGKLVKDFLDR